MLISAKPEAPKEVHVPNQVAHSIVSFQGKNPILVRILLSNLVIRQPA